jgi:phosphatidylglycerophosphatase A
MLFDREINPLVLRNPRHWLAFGLGSGLARHAPGTFGTLVAIPLYLLLAQLPPAAYAVVVIAAFAAGVWLCDTVSRDLGVHDHGGIVWDEFVGYWITMFLAPLQWQWVLAGFALFRLFDIWKPWPIRWFDDNVRGGFGIMFDDVLAGVAAWAALYAIRSWAGY